MDDNLKRSLFPKLRKIKRLIIDEVSMVRADLLDEIDRRMRRANSNDLPFGGVNVVFLGDAYQLPPVVTENETRYFGSSREYKSAYFFSKVIRENLCNMRHFHLTKVFRQTDTSFLDLLSKCRDSTVTNYDLKLINDLCVISKEFVPRNTLHITTRKKEAEQINLKNYSEINEKEYVFNAVITGDDRFFQNPENCPAPAELRLKVGTQILFIVNDKGKRFVNGTIAEVLKIDPGDDSITVKHKEGVFTVLPYV